MNRIIKWAEETEFKVSMEETKVIMFRRRKFPITTRSRMNIWVKGEKIEQVRQHYILRLIFDTNLNWLEHIKNAKARAEKKINIIKCLESRPRKPNDTRSHKQGAPDKTLLHQPVQN
jgi:hypothetical protein